MTERLSKAHRDVLHMIADRAHFNDAHDPGVMTSDRTFADRFNVFIHWRTCQTLHRRGLVVYPYIGSGWDGDNTSVALTLAGWEAINRTPPSKLVSSPAGECRPCADTHPDRGCADVGCTHNCQNWIDMNYPPGDADV